MWIVHIRKKTQKELKKLPPHVLEKLMTLIDDLEILGRPVRGDWPNYSKLFNNHHHCHLNYRYIAIWIEDKNALKIIEVTYVGSRENASY